MVDIAHLPGNATYYRHRESQERARAASAADRAVRSAHLAMAKRYAALVEADIIVLETGAP